MTRTRPWELPRSWATANCSRPRTRQPRRASSYTAALPMPPTPITITSYDVVPVGTTPHPAQSLVAAGALEVVGPPAWPCGDCRLGLGLGGWPLSFETD